MWFSRISDIFTNSEHKLARDYLIACAAAVVIATVSANFLASLMGTPSAENEALKIATVAPNTGTVRNYSEVRSVLDGEIGVSTLTTIDGKTNRRSVLDDDIVTGSTISKANSLHLDPCKLPTRN